MNDTIQSARDDLSFLRGLAEDGPGALARDGALLLTVGLIFSVVTLFYFFARSGLLAVDPLVEQWAWVAGVILMIATGPFLRRGFPQGHTAAGRALRAGMASVGVGLTVSGVALLLAAGRLGASNLPLQVFPIVMFTLYGAAWSVAFAARRRRWMALIAVGCFAATLALGFVAGQAVAWLVMSAGLLTLVAAPGYAMIRGKA